MNLFYVVCAFSSVFVVYLYASVCVCVCMCVSVHMSIKMDLRSLCSFFMFCFRYGCSDLLPAFCFDFDCLIIAKVPMLYSVFHFSEDYRCGLIDIMLYWYTIVFFNALPPPQAEADTAEPVLSAHLYERAPEWRPLTPSLSGDVKSCL